MMSMISIRYLAAPFASGGKKSCGKLNIQENRQQLKKTSKVYETQSPPPTPTPCLRPNPYPLQPLASSPPIRLPYPFTPSQINNPSPTTHPPPTHPLTPIPIQLPHPSSLLYHPYP